MTRHSDNLNYNLWRKIKMNEGKRRGIVEVTGQQSQWLMHFLSSLVITSIECWFAVDSLHAVSRLCT